MEVIYYVQIGFDLKKRLIRREECQGVELPGILLS
jgi:hypothetical protein